MKIAMSSKLKGSLLQECFLFSKKDYFLVIPVCTMYKYVNNIDEWEIYFGKEGRLSMKIKKQLCDVGALPENIFFYNYFVDDKLMNWSLFSYLIIPGGDAELGYTRLKNSGLINRIKTFKGNIIAYSAGALLLYKDYFLSPNWYYSKMKYCSGIGMKEMPAYMIEVHYDETDEMWKNVCNAMDYYHRDVMLIGDGGCVLYDNSTGKSTLIGEVRLAKWKKHTYEYVGQCSI